MFIYSFSRRKKKTNFNNIMQFLKPFFKVLNFFFILNKKKKKKKRDQVGTKVFRMEPNEVGKMMTIGKRKERK